MVMGLFEVLGLMGTAVFGSWLLTALVAFGFFAALMWAARLPMSVTVFLSFILAVGLGGWQATRLGINIQGISGDFAVIIIPFIILLAVGVFLAVSSLKQN